MSSLLLSSKIVIEEEEPQIRQIPSAPTSVLGVVGVTEKGPIGEYVEVTSPEQFKAIFGGYVTSGEVAQALDGWWTNQQGQKAYVARVVHCTDASDPTTKTSAAASLTLQSDAVAASAGYAAASVAAPWALAHGDTLVVAIDGGLPATATFNATAAARENTPAETYALSNGQTLILKVDRGAVQTIAFLTSEFVDIANATAEEVAAVINANVAGARATVTSGGTKVTITSDTKGTGSYIEVTGGTANTALAFNTAEVQGTGNVADITQVSAAEAETVIEAAVAGCAVSVVGGYLRITSSTTGASSSVQVQASSTADDEFGFDNATHSGSAGGVVNVIDVDAKYDGTYANALSIQIAAATNGEAACFNLLIVRAGVILETWPNLSTDSASDDYYETVVNDESTGSNYITLTDLLSGYGPAVGTFGPLTGGDDGLVGLVDADFTGGVGVNGRVGMRTLDLALDLALLIIPGRATSAVHNAMVAYCEVTRNRSVFPILDPPAAMSATDIVTYVETTAALLGLSEFGAIYWPRIKVANPSTAVFGSGTTITVAPSGYVAGVCARTDAARGGGVYDAPAGTERGVVFGCLGFETDEVLDEAKRDLVYPKRINPITRIKGSPCYIDGSRTLKANGNFPSVSERRGVIFIEQSIKDGLQYARHSNNDELLRASVARTVEGFLTVQMKHRAFRSQDPAKAFLVDFGEGLNTPAVVFANKLVGRIGLATQKPAEFIVLRFSQDTRAFDTAA
jgi:hypothetical protein